MSPKVCILTPNPSDPSASARWPDVLERMAAPMRAEGLAVESRSWVAEPDGLAGYDLVLPMVAWGYHRDHALWQERAAQWTAMDLPMLNPPQVLSWNADKRYLGRLQEKGAPVIPTAFVETLAEADLHAIAREFGAEVLIVKPQVSAGSYQTLRVAPGDVLDDPPRGPAMIQPYLDAVEGEGELSLVFIDRRFSHALRKVAGAGDFRVQLEWGGACLEWTPDSDVLAAAEAVLAAVDEPLLYARVDMVRDGQGRARLMELELIEPDLYLDFDPERGAGFARAVRLAAEAR